MAHAALLLAAAVAASGGEPAAPPRGVELVSAQVTARIVQPAIVRQAGGPERPAPDAPSPQITRRGAQVLVEYQ